MNQKLAHGLLCLLGLGLPLHGALTVFGPDWLRWWKEGILIGLIAILVVSVWPVRKTWWAKLIRLTPQAIITSPLTYALLFLAWLEVLVWFSPDFVTGLIAARYLSLGFIVLLLIWGLGQVFDSKKVFHKFSTGLISGTLFSLAFGIWAQFLGGFNVLEKWYSNTISSWVPGQTLPLYHQTSEGMIRMQGMSSGPIEFSHLLVLALWLVLRQEISLKRWSLALMLLFGIVMSGSRSALLAGLLVFVFYVGKQLIPKNVQVLDTHWAVNAVLIVLLMIAGLGGLKYVVSELPETHLSKAIRLSDSDHITRPIEAFQMGMNSPIIGNLGQLGPAARAHNMKTINQDQAPIAENVFIDYFAQLGLLGLILAVCFWVSWFVRVWDWEYWVLGTGMLIMMNLATILDMTPIAISFFVILAFGVSLPKKKTT